MDLGKLLTLRDEFPVTEHYAYLNHASVAPLPRRGVERVTALAQRISVTGDQTWADRNATSEEVRALAARLLGARETHEVAFVENTSTGLSLVASGLPWEPGDNVVGVACEFPSNAYPWMNLEEWGVEYRTAPEREGRIDTEELLALVDDRTRVLALSWIEYSNGFRFDLTRIGTFCREHGVLFVVDVIQGLGGLVLDVERAKIDVACASAHKWLLGPEGIGLLYISDRIVDRFHPLRAGWRSMRDQGAWTELAIDWGPGAKRHESGSLNALGIHTFGVSLELLLGLGPTVVEERVLSLADLVARGLTRLGFSLVSSRRPGETSGIVAAVHPRVPAETLVQHLLGHGIVVSARAGRLRFSPHVYNTAEEIGRALDELATFPV
ncbi:MAG TPA: aminotransferase class V-fold PLP-dependent enzyme [Thermoanaerobaculia bacterium]|nr:aminotransferase class V-fold PLP-dependent enzyme [Thermoanaerobaculia bacterium]